MARIEKLVSFSLRMMVKSSKEMNNWRPTSLNITTGYSALMSVKGSP
jgi:hypothetical protein